MILRHGDDGFDDAWDALTAQDPLCPPLFSRAGVALELECHRHRGLTHEDVSFIVASEKREPWMGMRLAAMRYQDASPELSAYGYFATAIKAPSAPGHVTDAFSKELTNTCSAFPGDVLKFRDLLERGTLSIPSQQLLAAGSMAKPRFNRMVDLNLSPELLAANRRRRYKNLVAWGEKNLTIAILNAQSANPDIFEQCRLLHVREAGCETRNRRSWELQLERIRAGEAYAVTGHLNGELVSFGYFTHTSRLALYYSSASRRDMDDPLFHSLLWHAILHARTLGCEMFDIGGLLYSAVGGSTKEAQIAQFKAGFGGETRVYLDMTHTVPPLRTGAASN